MGELGNERAEALRELMESRGWRMFRDAVQAEWGKAACFERLELMLGKLPMGDAVAQEDATAQMVATHGAMMAMLEWPRRQYESMVSDMARDAADVPVVPRRAGGNR